MSGMPAVGAGTAATEAAHEPETDVPAPPAVDDANPTGPVDAADTTPGVRADIPAPAEAVEAAEAATASSDAEKLREDVLAPDHGSRRALDPENEDEQATTPIPARETSVKRPVQVPAARAHRSPGHHRRGGRRSPLHSCRPPDAYPPGNGRITGGSP